MTPRVALTIAGSDSGGGAGIQADLKTFAALGVFGTSALTAVTAQSTTGVTAVVAIDPAFVVAQVDAVVDDLVPAATKTGMLAQPATVVAVARLAAAGTLRNLVVDPVLVSTTGSALMAPGGVEAYRELLVPHAAVVTPNLREAACLTGRAVDQVASITAMTEMAEELRALGAGVVVVKGGHLHRSAESPDVVAGPDGIVVLPAHRVPTTNDHGTGCSLSAGIAAGLALGTDPLAAVTRAKDFVHRALAGARGWRLGAGRGPIDHFGWEHQPQPEP
ncbi:MAG: bifunctional hydroxymethylpyrimidine kinase/phosphomethylpyrimidine kinase [Acidimicrobiales bacterium]